MEKRIELLPLAEVGHGCAKVSDSSVELEVSGINGGMKAWLIGGEAMPIGNIVDGRLKKRIDTRGHIGILITQGGRQMLIGKFSDEKAEPSELEAVKPQLPESPSAEPAQPEKEPFEVSGFNWRKFTEKSFSGISRELRFILSNKNVYDNYKKYGHYWVGEGSNCGALALKCEENDRDPLEFLGKMKITQNGYVIVCVDNKTNKLYIPT